MNVNTRNYYFCDFFGTKFWSEQIDAYTLHLVAKSELASRNVDDINGLTEMSLELKKNGVALFTRWPDLADSALLAQSTALHWKKLNEMEKCLIHLNV